jgi:hypothetical protein
MHGAKINNILETSKENAQKISEASIASEKSIYLILCFNVSGLLPLVLCLFYYKWFVIFYIRLSIIYISPQNRQA